MFSVNSAYRNIFSADKNTVQSWDASPGLVWMIIGMY